MLSRIGQDAVSEPFGDSQSVDLIAGLTGNEWGDLSAYIDPPTVVWVPIWDVADFSGRNSVYHIVGYGAIVFTSQTDDGKKHAKELRGQRITGLCPSVEDPDNPGYWVDTTVPDTTYCYMPGDSLLIDAGGEVQLVR